MCNPGSLDHVIYGEGKPTHIISVGAGDQPKKPKQMRAFDISDTGDYAATLYFSGLEAHVEVWDLRDTARDGEPSRRPRILDQPYSRATINIPESLAQLEDTRRVTIPISVSFTGQQVTICTVDSQLGNQDDQGIPFQVWKCSPTSAIDLASSWNLQRTPTICDDRYFILVSHHRSDRTNNEVEDERFWVTDGCSFTVYDTRGKWSALYTLHMQPQADILTAHTVMTSIHGRFFAWTSARGAISVWNFETGQLVSHVYIGAQDHAAYPVLSSDGSMIAVTYKNTIQIRETLTGIKLGVFRKGLKNEKYFEPFFLKNHFVVYNPGAATSSWPMKHNRRSLIRLRDMAIDKTIAIHEDYRFQYPQTGGDPVFAYCHVCISSNVFMDLATDLEGNLTVVTNDYTL